MTATLHSTKLANLGTVVDGVHVLRIEDDQYALYERTSEGLTSLGRYDSPAIAMNVLDLLDAA